MQLSPPRIDAIPSCSVNKCSHLFPGPVSSVLAYKKVAKKVRPVPASLPEDYHIIHQCPSDPLASLAPLLVNPLPFTPGQRLTQE